MGLYVLDVTGPASIDYGAGNDWEGVVCSIDEGHRRAGRRTTNLKLKVLGSSLMDFSTTTFADIVVSDHALRVLREEGLTGFEVRPTLITSSHGANGLGELPTMWEFIVTGWGGVANEESGISLREFCPSCRHVVYNGLASPRSLRVSDWDGSSFFLVWPMTRYCFLDGRAREVLERHGLSGVSFREIEDLEPTDCFTPGPLPVEFNDKSNG